MRQLIKFFIIFLIAYGALLFCFYSDAVRIKMNSFYSKTTSSFIKLGLPSAHIETQNVFLPNRKIDPQKVFLVYGNPETIKREMEEARRNRLFFWIIYSSIVIFGKFIYSNSYEIRSEVVEFNNSHVIHVSLYKFKDNILCFICDFWFYYWNL